VSRDTRPNGAVEVVSRTSANRSDHVEGEAELARKQDSFDDDGVIDKHEQKEIDRAHKRQLESRGRGLAQLKPYRTGKWMMRVSRRDERGLVWRLTRRGSKTACRVERIKRANVSPLFDVPRCLPAGKSPSS
jgi:hypothetical protein